MKCDTEIGGGLELPRCVGDGELARVEVCLRLSCDGANNKSSLATNTRRNWQGSTRRPGLQAGGSAERRNMRKGEGEYPLTFYVASSRSGAVLGLNLVGFLQVVAMSESRRAEARGN